ncbi:TetR/AcrR family transcriptional regulator [Luminiphilus sp.]|nr:TetR/AcrR family transcriptional regulator [Luminiphilus sp.]
MEAAATILLEKGFSALTVRNTSEVAGIRMATLQYYFPSRQHLFEAAFGNVVDKAWAEMMNTADQHGTVDAKDHLQQFVEAMCDSTFNSPLVGFFIELWAAARVHAYAAEIMVNYYEEAIVVFTKLIRAAHPKHSVQKSRRLATLALSIIEGQTVFNQMDALTPKPMGIPITVVVDTIMGLISE